MRGNTRKPAWLHVAAASAADLLLAGVYVLLMRLSVDATRVDRDTSASERDAVYLAIHVALLVAAGAGGFALGKWLDGFALAYTTLLVVALAVAMLAIQIGAYQLACAGHNDIVRHWQCQ